MKYTILFTIVFFGFQSIAYSQRGDGGKKGKIEHLKSTLGLSDTQAEDLQSAFLKVKEDGQSTTREEKKVELDKAVADILTEDQLVKYNAIRDTRKGFKNKKANKRKWGKKMKSWIVKDEETLNKLREMRQELDESISLEDKQLIDDLRQTFAQHKAERKTARKEMKELSHEERKALKEERKQIREGTKVDREKAKSLSEKYETEIASLFEDNKTFFEEKKAIRKEKLKSIKQEHRDAKDLEKETKEKIGTKRKAKASENRIHTRKQWGNDGKRHFSKEVMFLLMDTEIVEDVKQEANSIILAPNPASNMTNVTYEVKKQGHIKVEIRDDMGRIYEVIVDESLEPGTYTKALETSRFQDRTYYISISDGTSVKTEKLIILK